HLLSAAWRWQGVCRMRPRLSPGPRLSTRPQGDLSGRRVPDTPLALRPSPSGRAYHLAHPVHHVSRGVHGAPPLRLALSPDAPGGGPRCPTGDAWRTECRALCRALSYRPDGPLSLGLCLWSPESGDGAHPVWSAPAH